MTTRALAADLADAEFKLKEQLVEQRTRAGLSQRELADLIGVHKSTISRMERLDSDPRLSEIREYAFYTNTMLTLLAKPWALSSAEDELVGEQFTRSVTLRIEQSQRILRESLSIYASDESNWSESHTLPDYKATTCH